jgi:Leucine-rich repeat (LRR) protein
MALYLTGSDIATIPGEIGNLIHLTTLELSGYKIQSYNNPA